MNMQSAEIGESILNHISPRKCHHPFHCTKSPLPACRSHRQSDKNTEQNVDLRKKTRITETERIDRSFINLSTYRIKLMTKPNIDLSHVTLKPPHVTLKPNIDSSHVTFLEKYGLYARKYEELYEKERK